MRAAGKCDLRRAEAEAIDGAAFEERQRLQRLDRRAGENGAGDVADAGHHLAVGAYDGDGAGVHALDESAARQLDQDRIAHGVARHARLSHTMSMG